MISIWKQGTANTLNKTHLLILRVNITEAFDTFGRRAAFLGYPLEKTD